MCGCNDTKFSQRGHSHNQFATKAYISELISDYWTEQQILDYLSSNFYTQAEVDILIANLQTQIDDCCGGGGGPGPCSGGWENTFTTQAEVDEWTILQGDWDMDLLVGELKLSYHAGDQINFFITHSLVTPITLSNEHTFEAIFSSNPRITGNTFSVIIEGEFEDETVPVIIDILGYDQSESVLLTSFPEISVGTVLKGFVVYAGVDPGEIETGRMWLRNMRVYCA